MPDDPRDDSLHGPAADGTVAAHGAPTTARRVLTAVRGRVASRVVSLVDRTPAVGRLHGSLEEFAREFRDLNAATTDGYRRGDDHVRAELDHAVGELDRRMTRWVPESVDALRRHLETRIDEAVAVAMESLTTRVRRLERRGTSPTPTPTPIPKGTATTGLTDADDAAGAAVGSRADAVGAAISDLGIDYSAFEDELRGSPAHVRRLAAVHVETIASFGAGDLPVLDVGCGRGELLELLRGAGSTRGSTSTPSRSRSAAKQGSTWWEATLSSCWVPSGRGRCGPWWVCTWSST
ncbi:MAG: hypothetical protein R2698_01915 [Microthrixaceae bacterium]